MRILNLEQLRTLVAVAEAGSLTAAAPQVFLSQSAVSEQLRKLEQQVGQTLLLRSKAGVQPTVAGVRLLDYARRMLALGEEACLALHGVALAGTLRLGVTDYFRPAELAVLLARVQAQYPGVRLQVAVDKSGVVEAAYARGEFDVGVTMRLPGSTARAAGRALPLRREPLQWMAAPHWKREPGVPLPLLALPSTCALHQFTAALLEKRRIAFTVALAASGVAGLQSALAAGLGVACLNASALCEGVQALRPGAGLPALPQACFVVLPPREGESDFVRRARELLVEGFG